MLTRPLSIMLVIAAMILASVGCSALPNASSSTTAPTKTAAIQATTGPAGVPVFDPATNVTATDQVLNYNTTASVASVAQFYEDQMAKLGWSLVGDPYIEDTVAKITFSKNGKVADIGIAIDAKSNLTAIGILVQ